MASSTGKNIKITLFGESHGSLIGVTIEGLKSGIKLDLDYINYELQKYRFCRNGIFNGSCFCCLSPFR